MRILDELEAVYLRLREIEVEGVAVIRLRVNNGGGDGICNKLSNDLISTQKIKMW